jgi:hypothetical protein
MTKTDPASKRDLRKPTIYSDAILAMLRAPAKTVNGLLELDEVRSNFSWCRVNSYRMALELRHVLKAVHGVLQRNKACFKSTQVLFRSR